MKNTVKSQKGITLVALVVTVIVLLILAGIGIGELSNNNEDITQTKDTMSLAELNKVQQVVIENYLKYIQIKNEHILTGVGQKIDEEKYNEINNKLKQISNNEFHLIDFSDNTDESYYMLNGDDLKSLGLQNIHNNDVYVVNYSTGEVFNYTQQKNASGDILYIKGKN